MEKDEKDAEETAAKTGIARAANLYSEARLRGDGLGAMAVLTKIIVEQLEKGIEPEKIAEILRGGKDDKNVL